METIRVTFRGTRVPLGKHPHEVLSEGEEFTAPTWEVCYEQAKQRADELVRVFGVPVRAYEDGDRVAFYETEEDGK